MKIEHLVKNKVKGCPFGHSCDECNLYVAMYKTDKDGSVVQQWDCTFNNIAVLISETKNRTMGVQQAVEGRMNALLTLADKQKKIMQQ